MQPHPRPSADHFTRVQASGIWTSIVTGFADLLPAPPPNARAIDIGCGPGSLCRLLADRGWQVVGVDNNPEMVERATALATEAGYRPADLTFRHGELPGLDLADPADLADPGFALVTSLNLLFFLADPVAAIHEMRRICRPGGTVATLNPCPELTVERAHDLARERQLPELDTQILVNWAALGELNTAEFDRVFDRDLVLDAFERAGIDDAKWYETPVPGMAGVAIGHVD